MADDPVFFTGSSDAQAYLRELGLLWLGWIVGLAVLFVNNGWFLLIGGVAVIILLVRLVKPLQRRVARLIPVDDPAAQSGRRGGQTTTRDRLLRDLVYGEAPIRAAVDLAPAGRWWLVARYGMLGATLIAFVAVLVTV